MRRRALLPFIVAAHLFVSMTAEASSALELVAIAHRHEAAREEEIALRRYMEALVLDPTCGEAYLGLGALRARRGDLREADRVYSVALDHRPDLREARTARAHVRRALGLRAEAVGDLNVAAEDDPSTLRILAGWYGEDDQAPAQLATWRRILVRARADGNPSLVQEATAMVRALVLLVGTADPAAAPANDQGVRRLLATMAKLGR